jgi:hypothetical protein
MQVGTDVDRRTVLAGDTQEQLVNDLKLSFTKDELKQLSATHTNIFKVLPMQNTLRMT